MFHVALDHALEGSNKELDSLSLQCPLSVAEHFWNQKPNKSKCSLEDIPNSTFKKKKINHLLILSTGIIISFSFPFFFLICLFFKERYIKKANLRLVKKYFKQKDYHKVGK